MNILIIGNSSIAQRRVIPALCLINDIRKIDVASRRLIHDDTVPVDKRGKYFNSYQNAIDTTSADIVYVSLLNSEHAKWVEAALLANKHVVVDKPALMDLVKAKQLVELSQNKSLCLAEATVFTMHPQVAMIKNLFDDSMQAINRVSAIFSIPPLPLENFRNHPEHGGGSFWDLVAYVVATSRILFERAPLKVFAEKLTFHKITGVDTAFSVMMTYSEGRSFVGHYGFDTEYINQINIFGHNCSVYAERFFTTPPNVENRLIVKRENNEQIKYSECGDAFKIYFENLVDDIKQNNLKHHGEILLEDAILTDRLLRECNNENPSLGL